MAEVNVNDVTWSIQKLGYAATDPRMDGYYQWGQKQKLYKILWETQRQLKRCSEFYKILWETQRQLKRCSEFYGEADWLNEHNEEVIIEKLTGY